jgi:acyl-CoA reductase-like NAD-dependent aldehyde dehydrogenase
VRTIRAVLAENGIDPNLVTPVRADQRETTQALVTHPAVKSVDFTGGNVFGQWLIDHCRQAQVYAELAGVNNIVIDSTDAYKACWATWPSPVAVFRPDVHHLAGDFRARRRH